MFHRFVFFEKIVAKVHITRVMSRHNTRKTDAIDKPHKEYYYFCYSKLTRKKIGNDRTNIYP